ncbi:MAG: metalloregulator ArsR/SmtB family transcription factor [Candidatus Staskawiczbacteria bacterium]|nr:metalloregulator ArsR/SmtB family transcription factor [Candidatus Staskawiczbacteria bacterium]
MEEKIDEKSLVKVLKAVANENRFLILKCLYKNKKLAVGDLAEMIDLPFRSVSKDLGVLRRVELVQFRNFNLNRYYSLNTTKVSKELFHFLVEWWDN